jgi:putative transcriptional regulator
MSFKNKVLVAHPNLNHNIFSRSVIYIYEDSSHGTCGVVLNKEGERSLGDLCVVKGIMPYNNAHTPIYLGGPVRQSVILLLHTADWASANTTYIQDDICVSSDNHMLESLVSGSEPMRWRLFNGISVWQPGQLEREIKGVQPFKKENSWLVIEDGVDLLFAEDGIPQWERAVSFASTQMFNHYI